MWKCAYCGGVQRSVSNKCPQCRRSFKESAPFAGSLEIIEQVLRTLSFQSHSALEIAEVEKEALTCLSHDSMSLPAIASQLEDEGVPVATSFAHTLRNLAG
jgi:hypothetical protein